MKKLYLALSIVLLSQGAALLALDYGSTFENLMTEARNNYVDKDYLKALQTYRSAEALEPLSAQAVQGEANCFVAQGRRREALGAYRRALELAPEDADLATRVRQLERESENWQNHTGLALGGPRWGAVYLLPRSGDFDSFSKDVKNKYHIELQNPLLSAFGWQFEYRFVTTDSGITALSEFIPVVVGLDQGIALPSLSWLLGFRNSSRFELGAGPNFSASGVGFIIGTGFTVGSDQLNFPFNLSYASSKEVSRVSLSVGFNL